MARIETAKDLKTQADRAVVRQLQTTLSSSVSLDGFGVHSARPARITLHPAEADAGIVYASDAPASNTQVATLPIPDALNVPVSYPIALVLDSTQPQAARDFVKYVLSAEGQATLARFGFLGAAEP